MIPGLWNCPWHLPNEAYTENRCSGSNMRLIVALGDNCFEGKFSFATHEQAVGHSEGATHFSVLQASQRWVLAGILEPRWQQVWCPEGSLGHCTDEGTTCERTILHRALDKWLLTGFYVSQHQAACGPCRTSAQTSTSLLRVSGYSARPGSPEVLQVQMSRWKTIPDGLWLPTEYIRVIV